MKARPLRRFQMTLHVDADSATQVRVLLLEMAAEIGKGGRWMLKKTSSKRLACAVIAAERITVKSHRAAMREYRKED